jgi:hypothetical protein
MNAHERSQRIVAIRGVTQIRALIVAGLILCHIGWLTLLQRGCDRRRYRPRLRRLQPNGPEQNCKN